MLINGEKIIKPTPLSFEHSVSNQKLLHIMNQESLWVKEDGRVKALTRIPSGPEGETPWSRGNERYMATRKSAVPLPTILQFFQKQPNRGVSKKDWNVVDRNHERREDDSIWTWSKWMDCQLSIGQLLNNIMYNYYYNNKRDHKNVVQHKIIVIIIRKYTVIANVIDFTKESKKILLLNIVLSK